MKSSGRYWLMIAVLVGATTGMAYLSHGEATPPAKPLAEFPNGIAGFTQFANWPFDQKTIDLLGVTDYLNRGYVSSRRPGDLVHRIFPEPADWQKHSLSQELLAGSRVDADDGDHLSTSAR